MLLDALKGGYNLIAEYSMEMIDLFDRESFNYIYASPANYRLLGFTPEELMGQHGLGLVHPEDLEYAQALLAEGLKKGSVTGEFRERKKDGSYIWVDVQGYLIKRAEQPDYIMVITRDINERKLAQIALQLSEKRYRLISENARDLICIVDANSFNFIYTSPSYSLLGYDEGELLGQSCLNIIHQDYKPLALIKLKELLINDWGSYRYQGIKKDGSFIWFESVGRLINTPTSSEFLIISRDISESKRAEEALRSNERRLREITDNMLDGIAVFDQDMEISYASSSCKNLLGYSPEEMLAKTNIKLVHPEDRRQFLYAVNQAIRKQSSVRLEFRCRHAEGYYIWLEAVGSVLIDDNSHYKGLVVAFRDIEARKQAEQRILENERQLKEQYDYLNNLINTMNEFCYIYDQDSNLTFVNKKTTDGLGYTEQEMLGRSIFDFVHPDDREMVRTIARQRLNSLDVGRYEHRIVCKNGKDLLVRIKGSPIINNGKITGAFVLCDDITEYRKLQSEMTRLDQMHTLGEIAAGLAHEIRNPMTTVNGFLQLLLKDEDFKNKKEYLEIMIEELNRANGILGEFLNLARNKIVDLKACQINQVIRSLAPLLQADAFLSDRTIVLKLGDVPELLLDVKEIRQLIINLVRNALEATPNGGMVEIITQQENDLVLLSIKDQGKGIPEDIKEKLGTPFFSTKDTGTGLGLAICFGIVQRHKARLEIDSGSSGTTFTVKFNHKPHYHSQKQGLYTDC
ncbi:MAG: PAS domain S-box protein [Syntrophomonadaceae bacterium]|nr:PAS domain S-box protein [Syntrophomonadaceae bacterium]